MRFGSLFSGIGGIDLGLEWAGMECAWQVEIDDYCQRILCKHWPDVPKYRDVREVGSHNLQPVDVIVGGFPCQPFSVAGKRGGKDDDRYLWPEMLRVIRELKPTWILGENVPGIIKMALDQVLSDLENEGYACQAFVIPACAVDAPHKRDRVWIVANSHSRLSIGQKHEVQTRRDAFGLGCEVIPDSDYWSGAMWGYGELSAASEVERGWSDNRGRTQEHEPGQWWEAEPCVGRVVDGIPNRVDRLKCLGNAVVPQLVAELGKAIMAVQ